MTTRSMVISAPASRVYEAIANPAQLPGVVPAIKQMKWLDNGTIQMDFEFGTRTETWHAQMVENDLQQGISFEDGSRRLTIEFNDSSGLDGTIVSITLKTPLFFNVVGEAPVVECALMETLTRIKMKIEGHGIDGYDEVGPDAEAIGDLGGQLVVDLNRESIPSSSDDSRADIHDADNFATRHAIQLTEHGGRPAADRSNFDDNLATWSRT